MAYGRGGVARAQAAQSGDVESMYEVDSQAASRYLSGEESEAYRSALDILGKSPQMKKSGKIKKSKKILSRHRQNIDKIQRLRNVAAGRALGEFQEQSMQLSKPWLQKAPEGLIEGETVQHSLGGLEDFGGGGSRPSRGGRSRRRRELMGEAEFGAVDPLTAQNVREDIMGASEGGYRSGFLGDSSMRAVARTMRPSRRPRITDPTKAYLGIGRASSYFDWDR